MWVSARGSGTLFAMALLFASSSISAAEPLTRLTGMVLDARGKPLARVPVGIDLTKEVQTLREAQPKLTLAARTDPSGRFELRLPQSLERVVVVALGSGTVSALAPAKLDVSRLELPPLRLLPGLALTGRVSDESGRPVASVKIEAHFWNAPVTTVGPRQHLSTQSRKDGSFVMTGLQAGAHQLHAELAGYGIWDRGRDHNLDVNRESSKRTLEIMLHPATYLAGVVMDQRGQPLAGAKLGDYDRDIVTESDAAGRFRLGPLAAQTEAAVNVTLAGYSPQELRLETPQSDLQVVLSKNGVLRGRVTDTGTGAPLKEFQIAFGQYFKDEPTRRIRPIHYGPRTFTATNGRFELKDVTAGPWEIWMLAPGYVPRAQRVEISADEATPEVLIELKRGLTVRGRVIDKRSGAPLEGVRIGNAEPGDIAMMERLGSGHLAVSDAQGGFVLEGLPSGTVTLGAESSDHLPQSRSVTLTQDAFVELVLSRGATLGATVLAPDGVTPVEAEIDLVSDKGRLVSTTERSGRFVREFQPPGRYRIRGFTKTQVTPWQDVTLSEDHQLDDVRLILQPRPMVHGTISGLTAAELQQVKVAGKYADVTQPRNDRRINWATEAGEIDGTAYHVGLDPLTGASTAVVTVGPAQGPQVEKRITVAERGDTTLDFDFANGLQIAGRVTRSGRAAAGIPMSALPDEGQTVAGFTRTTASGEYHFADLAPGRYRVGPANGKGVQVLVTGQAIQAIQDFELP